MIRTVILLLFGGAMLILTLRRLREHRLMERHVLVFLLTGLPFLILGIWPDGIIMVSNLLDIERYTVIVLALACFTLLMMLEMLTIISVQERRITTLAQMVGILQQAQAQTGESESDGNVQGQDENRVEAARTSGGT